MLIRPPTPTLLPLLLLLRTHVIGALQVCPRIEGEMYLSLGCVSRRVAALSYQSQLFCHSLHCIVYGVYLLHVIGMNHLPDALRTHASTITMWTLPLHTLGGIMPRTPCFVNASDILL